MGSFPYISGFSAVCVLVWGSVMHIFVDGKYLMNEDERMESFTISSANNDSNFLDDLDMEDTSRGSISDRQRSGDDKCWKGYSNYHYLWIITGPMTLVIFVRLFFSNC